MAELSERKIKHLAMIQDVIGRMTSERARMKQFALIAVGVLYSAAAAIAEPLLAYTAAAASLAFWCLDAQYLAQERWYRVFYDEVRETGGAATFIMTPDVQIRKTATIFSTLLTWSVVPLYGTLTAISIFLAILIV
jgi:hypothetical protein